VIPSPSTPETPPSCPNNPQPSSSYTKINSDNTTTNTTNVTNVPPPENKPVNMTAEIEQSSPTKPSLPSSSTPPIDPLQLERIVLELQLAETAEYLTKPPNKRLKSKFLGEIEKRINTWLG